MKHRTVVVAFGGNALLREGEHGTDAEQARNADAAARVVVELVRRKLRVLVVHGNGPQVGNLLMQMDEAALKVPVSALDVAGAMSQGSIGYLLERAVRNQLARRAVSAEVATLITEVLVDEGAESMRPTKPVGPFFSRYRAQTLRRRSGWTLIEDAGRGWRKVVPSPRPLEVLNQAVIRELIDAGRVVIAAGGGGIPVRRDPGGRLVGVEAVIDKDHTASLLARTIGATLFVLLTQVAQVELDFGTPRARGIGQIAAGEMRRHLEEGQFPEGSMGPKIEGVLTFLDAGGTEAIITDAASFRAALRGRAGTRIYRDRFA